MAKSTAMNMKPEKNNSQDRHDISKEEMDRPLVTFAVFAYNQERFIREAVEGAFSQTYSPLEIILSDDCSQDRTFEIMKEMAAEYNGPHTVILNRNEKNLGIGGHINRIMELARGELIVGAAGDDISLPERTQKIYDAWEASGRKAMSIYSLSRKINKDGKKLNIIGLPLQTYDLSLEVLVKNMTPYVQGCTHAWHRDVFKVFGPLIDELVYEDRAIPFRSAILGQILPINEPLVLYRQHSNNMTFKENKSSRLIDDIICIKNSENVHNYRKMIVYRSYLRDIDSAYKHNLIDIKQWRILHDEALRNLSLSKHYYCFETHNFGNKIASIRCVVLRGGHCKDIIKLLIKLISPHIYILARISRTYAARKCSISDKSRP